MPTDPPIPNTLRLLRKQAHLTQSEVAAKLGFESTDRISRWEHGLTFPHVVNLFKLAAIYKVPPHELYANLFASIGTQINSRRSEKGSDFGD